MRPAIAASAILLTAGTACAQSLFQREPPPAAPVYAELEPGAPLAGFSLLYVAPPEPKVFAKHDLVTIIIDENARHSSEQKLDTEKDYSVSATLADFPSLPELAKLQLANGIGTPVRLNLEGGHEFEGDGKYERTDRIQDRIQAEVIDIKPNGTLVLEARAFRDNNKQQQLVLLSGICRQEDVTSANTIMSSQLANKTLIIENDGEIDRAGRKGLIPRILESIFNF